MSFINIKPKFNLIYILYIFFSLIIISSANQNPKRFLEDDTISNTLEIDSTDIAEEENSDSTSISEDPGSYLLAWFVIFFFIGLYIICTMGRYPEISERTDDVYKFMFFANNGILVAASVNIFDIKNLIIDSSPFALSALVFIIGCICYISKYCQKCSIQFAIYYFSCDYLGELYKIPCFVWSIKSLSDPCCRSNSYTVYYYSDGHTESNECCHHMWNCIILIIKRLALIFTMISFYIFLLFYLIFWLIAKCIFLLVLKNKEESEEAQQNPQSQQSNNINVNNPNPNPNEPNSEINNMGQSEQQPYIGNQGIFQVNVNNDVRINNININNNMNNNINNESIYNNNNLNGEIIINQIAYNYNQVEIYNPNDIMHARQANINQQERSHEPQNSEDIVFNDINQNNENDDNNNNFSPQNRELPELNEEEQNGQMPIQSPEGESERNNGEEDSNNENNPNEIKINEVESHNSMDGAPAPGLFDDQV